MILSVQSVQSAQKISSQKLTFSFLHLLQPLVLNHALIVLVHAVKKLKFYMKLVGLILDAQSLLFDRN